MPREYDKHIYEVDELVLGSSLGAVAYAYFNNIPIVVDGPKPFPFEFLAEGTDLSNFSISFETHTLTIPGGTKNLGERKVTIYEHLLFCMSLSGLLRSPVGGITPRIEKDILKITTPSNTLIQIKFNHLIFFPPPKNDSNRLLVIDWLDVRSGAKHKIDLIETSDYFVEQIYFYTSSRYDGNKSFKEPFKDAVALSYLTYEQVIDPDYSSLITRYKIRDEMANAGIKGRANGKYRDGRPRWLRIDIETASREVVPLREDAIEPASNITKLRMSDEEVFKKFSFSNTRVSKLERRILNV